jgi:hypothetical protein
VTIQQNFEPVQQPQKVEPPKQYFQIENPDQVRQQIEDHHVIRKQLIQSHQSVEQNQQPQFVVGKSSQPQPQHHLSGLIPPNRSNLVGMRGFLMCLKRFKKVIKNS